MNDLNPRLEDIIKGNNNDNNPIILNRHFQPWADHIVYNIKTRKGGYRKKKAKELLTMTKKHIKKNKSPLNSNNILFLTHPFYLSLTHRHKLNFITEPQAQNYFNKIITLFEKQISKDKLQIVVLETLHHYSAITSLLLEQNLIDNVILTQYDDGEPLSKTNVFKDYKNKQIFIGGGYNKKCLASSIGKMYKAGLNQNEIRFLKDMIIDSPLDNGETLEPKEIRITDYSDINIDNKKVITIEKMFKTIGYQDS